MSIGGYGGQLHDQTIARRKVQEVSQDDSWRVRYDILLDTIKDSTTTGVCWRNEYDMIQVNL